MANDLLSYVLDSGSNSYARLRRYTLSMLSTSSHPGATLKVSVRSTLLCSKRSSPRHRRRREGLTIDRFLLPPRTALARRGPVSTSSIVPSPPPSRARRVAHRLHPGYPARLAQRSSSSSLHGRGEAKIEKIGLGELVATLKKRFEEPINVTRRTKMIGTAGTRIVRRYVTTARHPRRPGQGPQHERVNVWDHASSRTLRRLAQSSVRETSGSPAPGCAGSRAEGAEESSNLYDTIPLEHVRPTPAGSDINIVPPIATTRSRCSLCCTCRTMDSTSTRVESLFSAANTRVQAPDSLILNPSTTASTRLPVEDTGAAQR